MRNNLAQTIETARESAGFQNYLQVRERVLDILDHMQADFPSDYWQEELAGFDYLLDAPPLIIQKLREHCYHITGLHSYEYRQHHAHKQPSFAKKLAALRELDAANLFIPESSQLGGFGHSVDGKLVNLDTLKFYEVLIALNKSGLLKPFREDKSQRKTVLEIGAGWGGFGYQFKTLFPNSTYIIVDLPQTMLFSGVYLKTLFPQAKIGFAGEITGDISAYDFVFVPHYQFEQTQLPPLDLAINMISFQEMTTEQVEGYVRQLHTIGTKSLYSLNRDRSAHNTQLTAVSSILEQYYDLTEIAVLEVPYTVLKVPEKALPTAPVRKSLRRQIKSVAKYLLGRNRPITSPPATRSVHEYRHVVGVRKD